MRAKLKAARKAAGLTRARDILFSQSPGFRLLRVVMGALLGLLLRQLFAPPKIF